MKNLKKIGYMCMAALTLTFTSCSDDDGGEASGTGSATFEVADAPIDNAEVQGVFVTVTDIKINGETASSFSGATTVDLLALQNGSTQVLATEDLNAGTYNNVTFTIDLAQDASGNSPGSYVLTSEGKEALEMSGKSTIDLVATGDYTVMANTTNNFVIDFDLRKMIKSEGSGSTGDNFTLVTQNEANAALRIVSKQRAGNVMGTVDMTGFQGADKVVVYAYKSGSFNESAETQAQGDSQIMFANAVSSTAVSGSMVGSGSFQLNFLEEGEYDLVYAAYSEDVTDGSLTFDGFIDTSAGINGEIIDTISVEANADVNLELSLNTIFG